MESIAQKFAYDLSEIEDYFIISHFLTPKSGAASNFIEAQNHLKAQISPARIEYLYSIIPEIAEQLAIIRDFYSK